MRHVTEFFKTKDVDEWESIKVVNGAVPNLSCGSMVLHEQNWYRVLYVETYIYDENYIVQNVVTKFVRNFGEHA